MAAAFLAGCAGGADAAERAAESNVKAAFLYKFPAYVEWPERDQNDSSAPVDIGVIGNEAVHAALQELAAGRASDERAIRVRPVRAVADVKDLHVLFIGEEAAESSNEYVAAAHGASVLTVTEQAAPEQNSIIDFVLMNGRVRFTISLPAAQRANLKISSRLLAVAQDVRKGDPE